MMKNGNGRIAAILLVILFAFLPLAAQSDGGNNNNNNGDNNNNNNGDNNNNGENNNRTSLACSLTQSGKAVINEVNTNADFVEVYLLQSANISNWALYVDSAKIKTLGTGSCFINGTTTPDNSGDNTTFPAGTYIYCAHNMNPSNNEVLLVDKNGSLSSGNATVIDYLSYGKPSPSAKWSVSSICGTLYPGHSASNQDIARLPNGTGSLADNGDNSTPGATNVGLSVSVNTPANFTCVESGVSASTGTLYTKIAGTAFGFDVVALKSDGSVQTAYASGGNKNVTVELVDGSGSTACAARTAISPAVSQSLTFSSANQGRKTTSSFTVSNAYANLRCRVMDANQSPSIVGCSTDNFAVRPIALTVTSTSATADSTGASGIATPVIKTGGSFNLTTTGIAGYNGLPSIDNSKLLAHSGAVQSGILTGSFAAANASTGAAASNFAYSEVGYFALAADGVYDSTFTAVDSSNGDCTADFSNTAVSGKYGCNFGNTSQSDYFGRFIPDHLVTQVLSNGSFAHACSNFTYNGQPLGYGASTHPMLSVYAYNASTPAAVTKNYTGKFNRLLASQFTLTAPTTDALQKGADHNNLLKLSAALGTPTLTDNGSGNLTLMLGNDIFTYQRENNALITPFSNAIAVTVSSAADSDGVTAISLPMVLQPSGENIRYGRVNLMNANGSELADLAVPMTAEYFNGTSFVTNTADLCSVATVSITDPLTTDTLQPSNTCIWDNGGLSGSAKCTGTAPTGESYAEGAGLAAGSFNLYLKAPGQGLTGPLTVTGAVANWLMFNWQGAGAVNPSATATFGIYKGNSKQIFFKEVY